MSKYGFPCKLMDVPVRGYVSMGNRWYMEIVQDFNGLYYANLWIEGQLVEGLPEYVDYKTLRTTIWDKTNIHIFNRKDMIFEGFGRKKYAHIDSTGGNTAWREKIDAEKNGYDCRITFKDIENGFTPDFTRYDLITKG